MDLSNIAVLFLNNILIIFPNFQKSMGKINGKPTGKIIEGKKKPGQRRVKQLVCGDELSGDELSRDELSENKLSGMNCPG